MQLPDNIPHQLIDKAIHWLKECRADIDLQISKLEAKKKAHERRSRRQSEFNQLAWRYALDDYDQRPRDERIKSWSNIATDKDARQLAELDKIACQHAKARRIEARNAEICRRADLGESPATLAREYGISRQQCHNVVNNHRDSRPFKFRR